MGAEAPDSVGAGRIWGKAGVWAPGPMARVADAVAKAADQIRGTLTPGQEPAVPLPLEVAAVLAMTLAALWLRAWGLESSPNGVHGDETELALEALRSARGENIGIWTGVTLGHPAGYAHWMGLLFRLGEPVVETMRLASAIPGAVMIPVGYLLVRGLFGIRVALLTAALLTFSFWFVIQSRIAFGGITGVFVAMLAMGLLVATVQSRRWWVGAAAGIALGLGLYTFKTFLLYFAGVWGAVLLLMVADRELRESRQLWLALGVSLLVGAPMLWFYATSGFLGPNLRDLYQVSLSSPSTWLRIPGLALDALLLVHQPVEGNTTDGAPAIPILPVVATAPFWLGLGISLLRVRERRHQLLLLGLLVGMLPLLFVPGVESRRYLLGMFFVLALVAVGADALLAALGGGIRQRLAGLRLRDGGRRLTLGVTVTVAVAFVAVFALQNTQEFQRWKGGDSLRWFFNQEYYRSLVFLKELDGPEQVRFYSARYSFDTNMRRFLLPGATGKDGAMEHGGSGWIPPPEEITVDTLVVLMDDYLPLAAALEAALPHAEKLGAGTDGDRTMFLVYRVRAGP